MKLNTLGIIGFGSIAQELFGVLARTLEQPLDQVLVLVRLGTESDRQRQLASDAAGLAKACRFVGTVEDLMVAKPDLVIECAGHQAVTDCAEVILRNGIELIVTSTGALSDARLHAQIVAAAQSGQTRMTVPAGAVGGIDILAGIHHSGDTQVTYTSRKPPAAWSGTPAEGVVALKEITAAATLFEGTARQAAADYPKNANTAATIALAGIGFDDTDVRLIADPEVSSNIHQIDINSSAGSVAIRVEGKASSANPKTSLPTVYSLVREVLRRVGPVAI